MDPFVSTIAKQAAVLGAAAGLLLGVAYFLIKYSSLQYALTLNMVPTQLP